MDAKQQMTEDGAPTALFIPQDQRKQHWITHMITLTNNTRGATQMTQDNYAEMNGPQLVTAYNIMTESRLGKELGAKPVQRFATPEAGRKRCEALASSIKARAAGIKGADDPEGVPPTKQKALSPAKSSEPTKAQKKSAPVATDDSFPEPKTKKGKVLAAFGARAGTNREKLITCLADNLNKQVAVTELVKATYGNSKEDNKGPLMMVLKGVQVMIEKGKLAYSLVKEKKDGDVSYRLVEK